MTKKPDNGLDELSGGVELEEEIHKQIDHQLELIRHYENRAERILRILIASVGIALTGLGIAVSSSSINVAGIRDVFTERNLNILRDNLTTISFVNEARATFIILIITVGTILILSYSIVSLYNIFSTLSKVIIPQSPKRSTRPYGNKTEQSEYIRILESNEDILKDKQEGLVQTIRTSFTTLKLGAFAIMIVLGVFLFGSAELAILSFVLMTGSWVIVIYKTISIEQVKEYGRIQPYLEICWVCLILMTLIIESVIIPDHVATVIGFVFFLLASGTAYKGLRYINRDSLIKYGIRNLTILFSSMLLLTFADVGTTYDFLLRYSAIFGLLLFIIVSMNMVGVIAISTGILKHSYGRIPTESFKEKVNERVDQ